jgi:trans-aconitate 3-methyltransferase
LFTSLTPLNEIVATAADINKSDPRAPFLVSTPLIHLGYGNFWVGSPRHPAPSLTFTDSKTTFSHASYASFRPSYPQHLYDLVLAFHRGPQRLLVDLGTGHGLICRSLSGAFDRVVGADPSEGMIKQAESATRKDEYPNVTFVQAFAESLPFLDDGSVDMVVAGQAAHWFDYPKLFQELNRIVRPGGTLAFWGYTDHVFPDYPIASKLLHDTAYGASKDLLGSYWQQPGRSIVQNYLRDIKPPLVMWEVERREYDPTVSMPQSKKGKMAMESRMTVAANMEYMRTWSSYHGWQEFHPEKKARNTGGKGDVVDELFEEIKNREPNWKSGGNWRDKEVDVVWGTAIVLARKKK